MKSLVTYLGLTLAIALQTTAANAIPTLYFDNANTTGANSGVIYSSGSGLMEIGATIFDSQDILPIPNLSGSILDITVSFDSIDASNPSPFTTIGLFTGVTGNDLTILDGASNVLLTGDFLGPVSLEGTNPIPGFIDGDAGSLLGTFSATGGSLSGIFGVGELIALELNLTTTFGATMFDNDFSGAVNGQIQAAVPEPAILSLLGLGLLFMGFLRIPGKTTTNNN